ISWLSCRSFQVLPGYHLLSRQHLGALACQSSVLLAPDLSRFRFRSSKPCLTRFHFVPPAHSVAWPALPPVCAALSARQPQAAQVAFCHTQARVPQRLPHPVDVPHLLIL